MPVCKQLLETAVKKDKDGFNKAIELFLLTCRKALTVTQPRTKFGRTVAGTRRFAGAMKEAIRRAEQRARADIEMKYAEDERGRSEAQGLAAANIDPDSVRDDEQEEDEQTAERNARAANMHSSRGHVGKGVDALSRQEMADIRDPEVQQALEKLANKPKDGEVMPVLPDDEPDMVPIPLDKVKAAFKASANGSAPDVWGISPAAWYVLTENTTCLAGLGTLVSAIANDSKMIDATSRQMLLACLLVPIRKRNARSKKDIRPITIPSSIIKVGERYKLGCLTEQNISALIPSMQLGVNTSAGVEKAVHSMQANGEVATATGDKDFAEINGDLSDAYGKISRAQLAQAVYSKQEAAPLHKIVSFCYKEPTYQLSYDKMGNLAFTSMSQEGVRQGGVSSSILFAIGLQEIIKQVKAAFPNVKITAIMDDVNLQGKVKEVFPAFDLFVRLASEWGLQLNKAKSAVMHSGDEASAELKSECHKRQLPEPRKFIKTLGTIIGNDDEAVKEFVQRQVQEAIDVMDKLHHKAISKQNAMRMLLQCIHPRLSYLARVVRPELVDREFRQFDTAAQATLARILGIRQDELTDKQRLQIQLPIKQGGFGLRAYQQTAPIQYLSSTLSAHEFISEAWESVINSSDEEAKFKLKQQAMWRSMEHCHRECRGMEDEQDNKQWLPAFCTAQQLLEHAKRLGEDTKQLQQALTEKMDRGMLANVYVAFDSSEVDNARLLATQAPGASVWITMKQRTSRQKMSNAAVELAGRQRLGCHCIHPSGLNMRCICEQQVNLLQHPEHIMHCPDLNHAGFHLSHNQVRDCLYELAHWCGYSVEREAELTKEDKMDLVLIDHRGNRFFVDVSGTMPTSTTQVRAASRTQRAAIAAREKEKVSRYGNLAKSSNAVLVPFVFERLGGLSDKAIELLQMLSNHRADIALDEEEWSVTEYLQASIAAAIHNGNSAMVSTALQKASSSLLRENVAELAA